MSDEVSEMDLGWECLTPRQQEVSVLVAAGMTNIEIGAALGIAVPTVRNHLVDIADRLHIKGDYGNRVRVRITRWVLSKGMGLEASDEQGSQPIC